MIEKWSELLSMPEKEMTDSSVSSFGQYVRSMGPGIVVVLTWLGAGDLVEAATAGGNYGYALMWSFVMALIFRYLFGTVKAEPSPKMVRKYHQRLIRMLQRSTLNPITVC